MFDRLVCGLLNRSTAMDSKEICVSLTHIRLFIAISQPNVNTIYTCYPLCWQVASQNNSKHTSDALTIRKRKEAHIVPRPPTRARFYWLCFTWVRSESAQQWHKCDKAKFKLSATIQWHRKVCHAAANNTFDSMKNENDKQILRQFIVSLPKRLLDLRHIARHGKKEKKVKPTIELLNIKCRN